LPLSEPPPLGSAYVQRSLTVAALNRGGYRFDKMRAALVPSWAKEIKGPPLINARAEGIETPLAIALPDS
jgi:putative SOS response-associated peptidase YedK